MATFTVTVRSKVGKPKLTFVEESACFEQVNVFVSVPAGQSRYVVIASSGTAASPAFDVAETITTDTNYTLLLDAQISTNSSSNTDFSIVVFKISLSSGDPVYYSHTLTRQATPNKC